jgi:hypothetical protein
MISPRSEDRATGPAFSASPNRCDADANLGPPSLEHLRLLVGFAAPLGPEQRVLLRVPVPQAADLHPRPEAMDSEGNEPAHYRQVGGVPRGAILQGVGQPPVKDRGIRPVECARGPPPAQLLFLGPLLQQHVVAPHLALLLPAPPRNAPLPGRFYRPACLWYTPMLEVSARRVYGASGPPSDMTPSWGTRVLLSLVEDGDDHETSGELTRRYGGTGQDIVQSPYRWAQQEARQERHQPSRNHAGPPDVPDRSHPCYTFPFATSRPPNPLPHDLHPLLTADEALVRVR